MPAEVVEIKRLRPVKWSAIDKRTGTFRQGFVETFLKYEGAQLLEEDGNPLLDSLGRHRTVSMASFAARYGIGGTTFRSWVFKARGYSRPTAVTSGQGYTLPIDRPSSPNSAVPAASTPVIPRGFSSTVDDHPRGTRQQHGQCEHCPEWKE